jgi:hypothetical protein
VIFLFSALVLLIRLHRFENPTGADGFFYLKQIESLSSFSGFYYKDYSFAFFPPALLNFFLHDPKLSYEIAIAAVFGGLAWVADRLATRDLDRRTLWVFRASSLAFYFYSLMFLELNLVFLKTATGLFFLLLACERKSRRAAAGAMVLAVLSHKLMFVFGMGLGLVWLYQNKKLRWWMVFPVLAGPLLYPRLSRHALDAWNRVSFDKFSPASLSHDYSLTIYGALLLAASAGLFWKRRPLPAFALLIPILFPDPLNSNSITFRLMLVSAPLFVIAVGLLAREAKIYAAALMTAALALNIHYNRPLKTWENPWPRMLPNAAELEKKLPDDALLYAPHGAEFYLAYKTKFRPRSFIIRDEPDDKTFRIAYVRPYLRKGTMLKNDLEQMTLLKVSENFWLFKEADWLALQQLHLFFPHAMNQLEPRPDFVANY